MSHFRYTVSYQIRIFKTIIFRFQKYTFTVTKILRLKFFRSRIDTEKWRCLMSYILPVQNGEHITKSKGTNRFVRSVKKVLGKVKKTYSAFQTLQEVNRISRYFSNYFAPIVAEDEVSKAGAHKIRHDVFCKELKLFEATSKDFESDHYDSYSKQCLIQHDRTGEFAGTVRLIMPSCKEEILPIEKIATDYITKPEYHPSNFNRDEICEISRIAIPQDFRRRKIDQFEGAARAAINEDTYSEIELRCFPLIAVGLYMATAALALKEGKKHAYFMVEPRLARSMRYIGIKLVKIGTEFEYVGTRAPYYIESNDFITHLTPSFRYMMDSFIKKIS